MLNIIISLLHFHRFVVDLLCFKCLSVPVAASLIGGEAAADVADAVEENFLPLEDDGMDQEPEEHVDRHQVSLLLVSVQLGHVLFCLMDPFRATINTFDFITL